MRRVPINIYFFVVVRIYSVIIYSKTIDFFKFFFFKKRNKQCLYPDSLGPRKIRRAVVDLVIVEFLLELILPSSVPPSAQFSFPSFFYFFSLKNDTKLLEIKSEQHGFLYP